MATEQYQIVPVQPSCNIVPVSNKCMYNVKPLVSHMRTPQKKKKLKLRVVETRYGFIQL